MSSSNQHSVVLQCIEDMEREKKKKKVEQDADLSYFYEIVKEDDQIVNENVTLLF